MMIMPVLPQQHHQCGVTLCYLVFILMSNCDGGGGLTLQMSLDLSVETSRLSDSSP